MLSSLLQRLGPRAHFDDPAPEDPICVIGDVHGCFPLLQDMLARVPEGHRAVLVGDYIDRGEHSAEVLRCLYARTDLICLMGNHEDMLLRFLDDPEHQGPRWIRHGGLQTLASFGIANVRPDMNASELSACHRQLQDTLGDDMIHWLRTRPASLLTGNILVAHAGADPAIAADQQLDQTLIWGHRDFTRKTRSDGLWVVHGHTITENPTTRDGRIAIDTGAYATGRLSAVCLSGAEPAFLCAAL